MELFVLTVRNLDRGSRRIRTALLGVYLSVARAQEQTNLRLGDLDVSRDYLNPTLDWLGPHPISRVFVLSNWDDTYTITPVIVDKAYKIHEL